MEVTLAELHEVQTNVLKDPFFIDKIMNVTTYTDRYICRATISFNNGSTYGAQVVEAKDLVELFAKLAETLNEIREKGFSI